MRFLRPDLAGWFLVIPVAFAFWLLYVRAKRLFRERAGIGPHLAGISRLSTSLGDVMTLAAAALALSMLVLAVMRPQLLLESQVPEYQQHDLILMLDRSASMYAQDIEPSRFGRAIAEIKNFLAHKPATIERVALVGFAGTPIVLSHLTSDLDTLFFFLDWIIEDEQFYYGTDIGAALNAAREVVEKDGRRRPAIYLVLSDGEDHGANLRAALARMRSEQARVHTIGIGGDAEVPIPFVELGRAAVLRDEDGRALTTRFSGDTLAQVAGVTGGRYFRSVTGTELTDALSDIVSSERKLVGWTTSVQYRDVYREALMVAALATFFLMIKL